MRRSEIWFEITYRVKNGKEFIYKSCHHRAKNPEQAKKWGINTYGENFRRVEKVDLDELNQGKERVYEQIIALQEPLGLQITKKVYESDFDLTEMLVGKPKRKEVRKYELIPERDY